MALDTSGWSPEPEPLVDAPKMADLVGSVIAFINPGGRKVWSEAVPEKNQNERAYVACEAVLIFPPGAGGMYERHDDYRVWQSTIYRHLAAPIRVFRILRDGQGYGVERVPQSLLDKVAEAVEVEGLQPPERGRRPMRAAAPSGGRERSYDEARAIMKGGDDDERF